MSTVLSRMNLRAKMMLVALLSLAMCAVPAALLVSDAFGRWRTAQQEQAGLAPALALLKLMRSTQQHRGLSNAALSGNAAAAAERRQLALELQSQLQGLDAAVASFNDAALAQRVTAHRAELAALLQAVQQPDMKPAASFAAHSALVQAQIELLYTVSVTSKMVLHPDPGGYFLQDVVLNQLPPLAETLARLRGGAMGLLTRHEASAAERAQLAALAAQLGAHVAAVDRSTQLALADAPYLRESIKPLLDETAKALSDALAYADARVVNAQALDEPAAQWWSRMTAAIDTQYRLADRAGERLADELRGSGEHARNELLLGVGGMLLLAVLCLSLIALVARQTTAAVQQALQVAEAVAGGDLTQRVSAHGNDECARMLRALDRMAQALAGTVASVRDNATQVASASTQIAQGNLDLSGRTEQQASALQQTAASIEELSGTVTLTAEHAREAATLMHGAHEVAARSGDAVGAMVDTMKQIDDSARRIGDIIGTIDGIAFQTNILALNAAVEAARAGEQGRGFAVVAGEVRTLAGRAAQAAREVRSLVGVSVERAQAGSEQAGRAGATMQEVIAAVERVGSIMQAISHAAQEESAGVQQVGQAMAEIDRATQQNAALVEESAAAAESLRCQAQALQLSVGAFRLA